MSSGSLTEAVFRPAALAAQVLAASGAPGLAGCDDDPRPWETPDAGASSPAWEPPGASTSLLGDAGILANPDPSSSSLGLADPVPVGGPWVSCYGAFRTSGEVKKDVTRLAYLCGPANGMRKRGETLVGPLGEGEPPLTMTVDVVQGDCVRVFAVGESPDMDVHVVVKSGREKPVASDHSEDHFPIVHPDRPFCALSDDTFTVELSARKGRGETAAEVWVLPAPKAFD
jgi:hypothetical protein